MKRIVIGALLASAASVAQAGDLPLYKPAPDWVKPAPPVDTAKLDGDSPILLVLDSQNRLADGQVWSYQEMATRLASPDVVTQAGTITLGWQPAKGDLIVHKVEILRGGERIDSLAGGRKFTVIRREQQLEKLAIDGTLSATMAVEGLRVGDVLHLVASTTNREPALKGQLQTGTMMPAAPTKVGFSRALFSWPVGTDIHWKAYSPGTRTAVTTGGGFRTLTVMGPLPKPADLPVDAPPRFRALPVVEAASFADWNAVSSTMAPLYATDGLIVPASDLAREATTLASAGADPLHRAAATLQLVQEKVRYLFIGMENGNYVPQTPAQTWALRYGDCKAKTLLLLALLRDLKIDAEPVLASSSLGDMVPQRLPSAAAFDHVLVHATIGDKDYWLDGTGSGARYADITDTPPFRWVLPVRAAGAALMPVPLRPPATPMVVVTVDYDQRGGLRLPTLVHAVMRVRGPMAEMIGLAKTQGSKEQKEQLVGGMLSGFTGDTPAISDYTLAYDAAAAEAVVDANGIVTTRWKRNDKRYRMDLDRTVTQLTFEPDRARPAWQSIPVATGTPTMASITTRVLLPPGIDGFALEGDTSIAKPLAGTAIQRSTTLAGGVITVRDVVSTDGADIAPADVATTRAAVALAKSRLLRAVAPADMPSRAALAQVGRSDGRFKPILAAMTKAIAASPDDADGYVNRAAFLTGVYDWKAALPDFDRAVALDPGIDRLLQRGWAYRMLGDDMKAAADYTAALKLDPASLTAINALGEIDVDHGRRAAAIARIDERIDAGGEAKWDAMDTKAQLLARAGDRDGALAAIDQAIVAKPGNPALLNGRCWVKATLNVMLDTALKDCTRSIELSESSVAALDSRALVYFRMNRFDEAIADLDAVLDADDAVAGSLFIRGVIRNRRGKANGNADLLAARTIVPQIDAEYKRWGIVP